MCRCRKAALLLEDHMPNPSLSKYSLHASQDREFVSLDIKLYNSDSLPVGEDIVQGQEGHIEGLTTEFSIPWPNPGRSLITAKVIWHVKLAYLFVTSQGGVI